MLVVGMCVLDGKSSAWLVGKSLVRFFDVGGIHIFGVVGGKIFGVVGGKSFGGGGISLAWWVALMVNRIKVCVCVLCRSPLLRRAWRPECASRCLPARAVQGRPEMTDIRASSFQRSQLVLRHLWWRGISLVLTQGAEKLHTSLV